MFEGKAFLWGAKPPLCSVFHGQTAFCLHILEICVGLKVRTPSVRAEKALVMTGMLSMAGKETQPGPVMSIILFTGKISTAVPGNRF